jgi:SAM-dependent methyltransferase
MSKIVFYLSYIPLRLYARYAEPTDALVFLFRIHKRLLTLISDRASDYEGGVHPKHRLMRYHDFFTERVREGEHVLDIGSGIGYLAYDLARAGAKTTGIELSEKNVAKANRLYKHPNLAFVRGDAWKDLPQGDFDTAVMSNVLEHIDDRVGFLKKVQGEAHPKRWLIRVPCFDRDWTVALAKELGLDYRLDDTHFTEFTRESFEREMRDAGLEVKSLEIRWGEIWSELTPRT